MPVVTIRLAGGFPIIEPKTGSVVLAEAALTFLAGGGGMGHPERCGRRRSSGVTHAQHQNLAKLFILNTIENNRRVPSLLQMAVKSLTGLIHNLLQDVNVLGFQILAYQTHR